MRRKLATCLRHVPEFSAVLLLVVLGALGWLVLEYRQTVDRVAHTVEVKASILSVFDHVQEAEGGARGFIITGSDLYLKHYVAAAETINPAIDQLRRLTADNPAQQQIITVLEPAIDTRFARLKALIDLSARNKCRSGIVNV